MSSEPHPESRARGVHALDGIRRASTTIDAMPHAITRFQDTPNPNALKCILEPPLPEPIRSYRSREQAGDDPLARALFQVPGVTGVLLSGGWMTVNKEDGAAWPAVKEGVAEVLKKA